jgi:hypothetical protein
VRIHRVAGRALNGHLRRPDGLTQLRYLPDVRPFRAGVAVLRTQPDSYRLRARKNGCVNRSVAPVEFPRSGHAAWTSARCTGLDRHRVLGVAAAGVHDRPPEARLP